jgi:hypothetical protein
MWERDASLPTVIEDAWSTSPGCNSLADLAQKITHTRGQLKEWSAEHFGRVTKEIRTKRNRLKKLWERPNSGGRDEEVRKISSDLDELLHREEMMWKQWPRVRWLAEGDRNTNFFHRKATWRQSKNTIKRIRGLNGNWTDDPGEIKEIANNFFRELYTKDSSVCPDDLLNLIHQPISALSKPLALMACRGASSNAIGL